MPGGKFGLIKILSSIFVVGIIFIITKNFHPSYLPTEQTANDCAIAEQNKLPANVPAEYRVAFGNSGALWITTDLTNKFTATTLCSSNANLKKVYATR
jgi:hypothetical protein